MEEYHIPVLYKEVIEKLVINRDGVYVDCTMGGGGHSLGILEAISEKGKLIAMDQDDAAIKYATEKLKKTGKNVDIYRDNFENLEMVIYMAGSDKVDGILMDIGVSSRQLDDEERGFSYREDARLDMRMDKRAKISAYEVVNEYSEEKLSKLIYTYGEESFARKIARRIVEKREENKIETTHQLVKIVESAINKRMDKHPAKKTFQALRIEVNRELEVLEKTVYKAIRLLKPGGRLAVITFHSLEDRIVKNIFKELEKGCTCPPTFPMCVCGKKPEIKIITKKPIIPSKEEVDINYRAHSSKLRVAERV